MHNYIGCICFPFLRCVFSNESSNCLPEQMQIHTGCICLIFLHCVLSNESSNGQHERIHSYIGCNCLTFLQCVFSNDSSNCLPERMHTHSGCICLTFRHCAFSNESSNCPYETLHSDIGSICSTFLHCLSLLSLNVSYFPWFVVQDFDPSRAHKRCCFPHKSCFKLLTYLLVLNWRNINIKLTWLSLWITLPVVFATPTPDQFSRWIWS